MDIAQLVADERWDAIDDYINGLPPHSRLREAMLDDPEHAALIVDMKAMEEAREKWTPKVSEYTLEVSLLSQLLGATSAVRDAIIATHGGKPTPHEPFPIPVTEVDRQEALREKQSLSGILEMAGFNPSEFL